MNELTRLKCLPLEGQPAMTAQQIAAHLARLPGWTLAGNAAAADAAIEKTYTFADYHRTLAFVNALAWVAHREDHHPELRVSYSRCVVRFNTHSVGGISINDFICAAMVDALQA